MVPSIFGENLFDEFWNDPFDMDRMLPRGRDPLYGKHSKNLMKTDVRETEGSYELDIDLPGFKKEEVNVELNNGYLTIEAAKSLDKDDTDKQGRYIRQERYAGSMSRSFYVGEGLEPKDIRAKFENGILQANKFGLHLFARLAASQPSPMRGRWHGEAVTDEVGALASGRHGPPHQSPAATASPHRGSPWGAQIPSLPFQGRWLGEAETERSLQI